MNDPLARILHGHTYNNFLNMNDAYYIFNLLNMKVDIFHLNC